MADFNEESNQSFKPTRIGSIPFFGALTRGLTKFVGPFMTAIPEFQKIFESALSGLLNNWRVWCGDDEIRAIHIGFDSYNTEVSVSLLTDREPYLKEEGIEPYGKRWPTADWRLNCINETSRHKFPDASKLLTWMEQNAEELSDDDLRNFNKQLQDMFFEVVTSQAIKDQLSRFRRVAKPIKIRVEWLLERGPLDAELVI